MPTTTNFGWTTPADTDLVKDGAAAIRTLGNGVDTSLVDLKGGTTGQILSKASNTDLDYTWINNDQGDITAVTAGTGLTGGGTTGAVTLTNDMATTITAAGDIVVGTGSGTYDNLPIGTTGQVLTADTTVSPYKVKWAAAASPSYTWTTYSPTVTGLTKGNGTETARYVKIDKTVFFSYRFVFGSTSAVTGALTVTLPSTAQGRAYQCTISLDDDGNNLFFAIPLLSIDKVEVRAANASGTYLSSTVTTSTIPFTWSTNDVINIAGTYEEA